MYHPENKLASDLVHDPMSGQHSSNAFDFANRTQVINNHPLQPGQQNISNDDATHKSFTVFEEIDHSKKSMIQFLTKVGSIQNL